MPPVLALSVMVRLGVVIVVAITFAVIVMPIVVFPVVGKCYPDQKGCEYYK